MLVIGLVIGFVVGILISISIIKLLIKKRGSKGYLILVESEYGDRAVGVKFNDPDSLDKKSFVILKVKQDTPK